MPLRRTSGSASSCACSSSSKGRRVRVGRDEPILFRSPRNSAPILGHFREGEPLSHFRSAVFRQISGYSGDAAKSAPRFGALYLGSISRWMACPQAGPRSKRDHNPRVWRGFLVGRPGPIPEVATVKPLGESAWDDSLVLTDREAQLGPLFACCRADAPAARCLARGSRRARLGLRDRCRTDPCCRFEKSHLGLGNLHPVAGDF